MEEKRIVWVGSARDDIRRFPPDARRKAGFELRAVQRGGEPTDFKAIPAIGAGAYEIRIHSQGAYRVLYVSKFEEAIYVLHAFQKKTQKTAKRDIEVGRQRYKKAQEESAQRNDRPRQR
jgi:phage-related protein